MVDFRLKGAGGTATAKRFRTSLVYLQPHIVFNFPVTVYLEIVYSLCEIHTLAEFYKSAMMVQSQKAEIFQVGKRHIKNHKMIDNRGNAKIALPRAC